MSKRSESAWADLLDVKGGASASSRLQRARAELMEHWFGDPGDPWPWLSGVDTTTKDLEFPPYTHFDAGTPIIWTTDERDHLAPAKPYPTYMPFMPLYTRTCASFKPEDRIILIDKTRQILATTGLMLSWDFVCRAVPNRLFLWSKISQEQAADQLNEKVRPVHKRLPKWVQLASPQSATPQARIVYGTDSQFRAVNQTAARGAARGSTATGIGVDEAAYQDMFEDIWDAAQPMTSKLAALTTALAGPPGATFFYEKISEGRKYRASKPRPRPA